MGQKILFRLLLAPLLTLFLAGSAHAKDFLFTAIGDQPYGHPEPFGELIKKINQQKENQFTIHVGDIKNGGSECSDQAFLNIKKMFDDFHQPLIYTPGDNEWTDCHRSSNGSHEPTERLEKIRQVFFRAPKNSKPVALKLQNQAQLFSDHALYIENQRWSKNGVLFITIHQVGSNNNLDPKIPGAIQEYEARNKANLQWLDSGFKLANQNQSAAIVIAMQADTFHPKAPKISGFSEFISKISTLAQEFKKPVLLIQGDSHEYVVDQPLKKLNPQAPDNVLRLVVPGANLTEAVEVKINGGKKEVLEFFTFRKYSAQ
jgi:hypothetical protein